MAEKPKTPSKEQAERRYKGLLDTIQKQKPDVYTKVKDMNRKDAIDALFAAGLEVKRILVQAAEVPGFFPELERIETIYQAFGMETSPRVQPPKQ